MREAGVDTLLLRRSAAFFMRAIMSPMGSFTDIRSSPARLDHARDLAVVGQFTERDTAHLELAIKGARAPGQLAPVADANLGGVARQLGELQPGGEALFERQ